MHRAAERNSWPWWQKHRAATAQLVGRHRRQRAEAVGAIILSGQYGMDTRHLQRRARVYVGDVGVSMWRTHDGGVQLVGKFEIVVKAALPAQQAWILVPQHRLSDGEFAHDLNLPAAPFVSNYVERHGDGIDYTDQSVSA
jgi:hypothetical protein